MKQRIFLAINLPDNLIDKLERLIGDLASKNSNHQVNWVNRDNLHLTVQFLGDLDETKIDKLGSILETEVTKINPAEFRLTQLDAFPHLDNPRVIFYGLKQFGGIEIYNWQRNLVNALVNKGFDVDMRRWKAHITLGRKKSAGPIKLVEQNLAGESFVASSVEIMSSELREDGAVYSVLGSFKFKKCLNLGMPYQASEKVPLPEITIERNLGLELVAFAVKNKPDLLEGFNDEAVEMMATAYKRPEFETATIEQIKKNKSFIKNIDKLKDQVFRALESVETEFETISNKKVKSDIKSREENLEETKNNLNELKEVFNPKPESFGIKKVVILPTDFNLSKNTGFGVNLGETYLIQSHIDNPDNLEHEFLHSIVNPIVEKLFEQISEEGKQKIIDLTSRDLIKSQGYGEHAFSLMCESLIRTYINTIRKDKKPNFEDFLNNINATITEDTFNKHFTGDSEFNRRCSVLKIKNLADLKEKAKDFFELFIFDKLSQRVHLLYQEYIKRKKNEPEIHFEDFLIAEFHNFIIND